MREVTICYGMTETSPVSTQTGADDDVEHRTRHRRPRAPARRGQDRRPGRAAAASPRGEPGELCTRGYCVMLGYWDEPETRPPRRSTRAGWMHTGDLATMDDDGYVKIVGRSKDMIIRGGENVYPREIEEFLYTHPDVADVQVVGVPDERYGEEIAAFVIAREGAALDTEAVREFCRGRIAHYKVPRYVIFVDEFPMTVTGKVQKFKLRETAIEELGLDAEVAETA